MKLVKVPRRLGWWNPERLAARHEDNRASALRQVAWSGIGTWAHDHAEGERCNERCVLFQPDEAPK